MPSAFTVPTGKAHWEVLLRARAIEAQAYVIASAQVITVLFCGCCVWSRWVWLFVGYGLVGYVVVGYGWVWCGRVGYGVVGYGRVWCGSIGCGRFAYGGVGVWSALGLVVRCAWRRWGVIALELVGYGMVAFVVIALSMIAFGICLFVACG